jgi:hypothetical protein
MPTFLHPHGIHEKIAGTFLVQGMISDEDNIQSFVHELFTGWIVGKNIQKLGAFPRFVKRVVLILFLAL